jgi:hypothetical protein
MSSKRSSQESSIGEGDANFLMSKIALRRRGRLFDGLLLRRLGSAHG